MDWLDFSGRRALVAGAGGIGSAVASQLVTLGADVVLADHDEARLGVVQDGTPDGKGSLQVVVGGLAEHEECRAAVRTAADLLGGIDVFVHAVGINDRRPVLETPQEVWRNIIEVNLSGAYWLGQAVGELMCQQGYGRVVYLSSVSGQLAHRHHAPYAASKGGLNQMLRVMAREWAGAGVTVNGVAPGYTETDLTREYLAKPGIREEMVGLVPAGRLGTAADVVGPIVFLASDQSAFVTGQILYVDGGRVLV